MAVITKQDNVDALLKNIKALVKREVLVGIPDSTAQRQPDGDDKQPVSNALIGYVQETGSPAQNIPARPFLVPGVANAREAIVAQMKKGAAAAASISSPDAAKSAIDQAQHATGLIAQNAARAKISDGPFDPLSDRTLAARRARGRSGTKPLVDTGQLRAAITYVVRDK